jgi:hypothetical protein
MNPSLIASLCLAVLLAACSDRVAGNGVAPTQVDAHELEGTWIAGPEGNAAGEACVLGPPGTTGLRSTITFSGNRWMQKHEMCIIPSGTKGYYVEMSSAGGTFSIGDITVASPDPAARLRALDLVSRKTSYTSYSLVGNQLHIASAFGTHDSTTPEKRAVQVGTHYSPVFKQVVENPAYVKQ